MEVGNLQAATTRRGTRLEAERGEYFDHVLKNQRHHNYLYPVSSEYKTMDDVGVGVYMRFTKVRKRVSAAIGERSPADVTTRNCSPRLRFPFFPANDWDAARDV